MTNLNVAEFLYQGEYALSGEADIEPVIKA